MQKTLLLVEDNEDDVFLFKVAAKKLNLSHPLRIARDGREAIELLREYTTAATTGPRLGLVLLDLKMPYVSGLEVLEWVRTVPALRALPVVVFSSSEQEADIEAAYRLGATSFLVKPSQPDQLLEMVRAINVYWFAQNRLPIHSPDRNSYATLEDTHVYR
jgi:CheY-like chemotaxis protein